MEKPAYYEVTTKTRLTKGGVIGVWLFVLSPIVQTVVLLAAGDFWNVFAIGFSLVCLAGFSSGMVMVIVGRQYVAYYKNPS